jgi:hypothetical protein
MAAMASSAAAVRSVTSTTGSPASTRARASGIAWRASSMVTTGITGARRA